MTSSKGPHSDICILQKTNLCAHVSSKSQLVKYTYLGLKGCILILMHTMNQHYPQCRVFLTDLYGPSELLFGGHKGNKSCPSFHYKPVISQTIPQYDQPLYLQASHITYGVQSL